MVSVALDEAIPLHDIADAKWRSLSDTINATNRYLQQASHLVDGLWGGCLDSEESTLVLSKLGEPPAFCLPIYLVTVGQGEDERVVYVGKTRSSIRFANGHHVALKLHHPKFANLAKTVYRCSVLLHVNDEYIALEWIDPESLAEKVLDRVETVLIYALQPELNALKRKCPTVGHPLHIHVQNYAGSDFPSDLVFWHRDGEPLAFVPANSAKRTR